MFNVSEKSKTIAKSFTNGAIKCGLAISQSDLRQNENVVAIEEEIKVIFGFEKPIPIGYRKVLVDIVKENSNVDEALSEFVDYVYNQFHWTSKYIDAYDKYVSNMC